VVSMTLSVTHPAKRPRRWESHFVAFPLPETSHAQAQMDERGENDRDFSIDGKMQDVRGVSAVPPEAP
jgi:hypothetical protein